MFRPCMMLIFASLSNHLLKSRPQFAIPTGENLYLCDKKSLNFRTCFEIPPFKHIALKFDFSCWIPCFVSTSEGFSMGGGYLCKLILPHLTTHIQPLAGGGGVQDHGGGVLQGGRCYSILSPRSNDPNHSARMFRGLKRSAPPAEWGC